MTWSELLFAHWAVDPSLVDSHLPAGLTLDTHEGTAWVGVVPFLMSDVALRGCPAIPGLSRFLELNVRTYVVKDGKPGVWFFSLDAENPIAVRAARATFNLPYMDADMALTEEKEPATIQYDSNRTHRSEPTASFSARYGSLGESFHTSPGTLEHWLTARYCLYSANKKGTLFRGQIDHPPWTLQAATCAIQENTMGDPLRFDFSGTPHLLCADPIRVQAWWTTRC